MTCHQGNTGRCPTIVWLISGIPSDNKVSYFNDTWPYTCYVTFSTAKMDGITSRRRRRRNYHILEDESDSSSGSLIHERSPEGVSVVFCEKCTLRHKRRRLASKRCLDCMQNLCEACADHDTLNKSWWFPFCLVQCLRFMFPCVKSTPHSVLDLSEIDNSLADHGGLPKWARFTSSDDVFVIPRVTRDSLRGKAKKRRPPRSYDSGHQASSWDTEEPDDRQPMDQQQRFKPSSNRRSIRGNIRLQYKYQTQNGVPTETVYTEHTFTSQPAHTNPRNNSTVYGAREDEPITPYIVEEPPDSCPICLEDIPVREARTLTCEHQIHTKCLVDLILRMDFDFGVKCPVCNQITRVKNYYAARDQWVYEFPVL